MAIITLDSGLYCHGAEVADAVAVRLGYARVDENVLFAAAAERGGIAVDKLRRTMYGPPPFFGGPGRDRPRHVALLRRAIAELIEQDRQVYLGLGGHLVPGSVSHVLKVCLAGTRSFRVEQAERRGVSRKEAERLIRKDDETRGEWLGWLFGLSPWEKSLFDLFLPMQDTTVEQAVEAICFQAATPAVATTERSTAALRDLRLAADVGLVLAEKGHDVDVSSEEGRVTILIKKHSVFLERFQHELEELARGVAGVRSATARPGPRYREPGIGFNVDLEVPSKVLLVDDEQEFVQTLSERLETRSMAPVIAYDGEGALAMVESDQPEVMVLDLKMPGIDGLEVLRRVKRTHPETEVIILTGHGSEAEERVASELGAFAYLRKPVDIELLTETMKAAYRKVNAGRAGTGPE